MSNLAIIERQAPAGNWIRVAECRNDGVTIKQIMDAQLKANPSYQKLRAIDSVTKQVIDIAFR